MTARGAWLRHAAGAARVAANRGDLWLPGALGSLAYVGWLPLVLTVVATPRTSDLTFLATSLFSSELFPLNVLLIAVLAALGVLVGCLVAALAEASLLRAAGLGTPGRTLTREVEATFSAMVLAILPVVAVAAALVSAAAAVAPAEFGAPDLGVPLVVRVALRLAPLLVALAVLAWVAQAFGAVTIRRAVGPAAMPVGEAAMASARDVLHHPVRRLGLALTAFVADLVGVGVAVALLRVTWSPIGAQLASGRLISPSALLLLVGFVAIWLTLTLAFGALHVWVSTWWSLELGASDAEARPGVQEAPV